jgi:4-hydroxy-3-methylbut-2-enyl diphosphate reductase
MIDIVLAKPRGFCAGVDRAITIVETALERFGSPIYVRHEVVHNTFVVQDLKQKGAVFVEELSDIPDGAIVIFSAHGVSQAVRQEAERRQLHVFDATCPLVTKVHFEVAHHGRQNRECILIGHKGHPEVEGTLGQYYATEGAIYLIETVAQIAALFIKNPDNLAFVTQTTLSVEETKEIIAALRARFPHIIGPKRDDICYATQNRQDAVALLAEKVDVVLVLGSPNSSNSNRLRELAEKLGASAYLIEGPENIQAHWLAGKSTIGVTAGASAPEVLVQRVVQYLQSILDETHVVELSGIEENRVFALPKALREEA